MPSFSALGVPVVILSQIDDILLDQVEEVTVTEEALVTKHPTESGVNVTDHIVNLPVEIRLSGRFVDSPFAGFGGATVQFNPAQALASFAASGLAGGGRSVEMWNTLEQLRDMKKRVTVAIQQRNYLNMAIVRLTAPRSRGDGGSQRFSVELREIITTHTQQQDEGTAAPEVEHAASSVNAGGPKAASPIGGI